MATAQKIATKTEGTLRRNMLKGWIDAGLVEAKCNSTLTDDFAGDAAANFGKTGYLPVRIKAKGELYCDTPKGFISFSEADFTNVGRSAWWNEDGTISFVIHGHESYTFRVKEDQAPTA